jgi:hypothetical protein
MIISMVEAKKFLVDEDDKGIEQYKDDDDEDEDPHLDHMILISIRKENMDLPYNHQG